jgi:hypothetical protein
MFPRTQGAFLANRRARLFDVAKLYCRVSAIARIDRIRQKSGKRRRGSIRAAISLTAFMHIIGTKATPKITISEACVLLTPLSNR